MKEQLIKIDKLIPYTQFLLENHLDDFVKEDLTRADLLDLPLIKLFAHLPQEQLFEVFKKITREAFTEIIDHQGLQGTHRLVESFRNNTNENIPAEKLNIRDIALTYNIRKHSFLKFLSLYTQDIEKGIEIITELEDFYAHRQNLIFQVYTEINTEILKNSEESFKSLAEASFEGIVIHDRGEILEVNETILTLLGYEKSDIIGKKIGLFTVEEEKAKIAQNIEQNFQGSYETVGIKKDGTHIPLEVIGRPVYYKGKLVRVAALRDISERKKQEEEKAKYYESLERLNDQLRKEKEFNEILIDNSVDMIIAFDRDMTITAWNKTLEQTGTRKEEAVGKNFYTLFPEYKGNDDYLQEVWKGKKVSLKEIPFRKSPGYYDAEIVPVFNEHKEITSVLSYCRNVTERKLTEEKLKEQEHFIKSIADSTPSMIYVSDNRIRRFVYGNKTLLEFLGMSEQQYLEIETNAILDLLHPEDVPEVLARYKEAENLKDNETIYLEYRNKNANGDWRWLGTTIKVFKRSDDGAIVQILGIALDITEKKQIEETLKEKTRLFQNILDSIPVMVSWKDIHNQLAGFNKAYEQSATLFGKELVTQDEHKLGIAQEAQHTDDMEIIRSGIPKLNIIESVDTDKGTVYAKTDKVPLKNRKGDTIGVIGTSTDITELKRMQHELHKLNSELEQRVEERTREAVEREKQYRFLADFVPQIFWTTDAEGIADYYNKNWYEYTRLAHKESITSEWKKVFHPDDVQKTYDLWMECVRTGRPYENEYRYLRASDKTYRWHLGRAVPLKDTDGKIVKWFGTSTDIHDQKMIEESIKMQALVLESMDEGVNVSDDKGYIIYTNKAMNRMFGYKAGELQGKHLTALNAYLQEENIKIVEEIIDQLNTKGAWSGEINNITKAGTPFTSFAHTTTLHLGEKKLFVCIQRDVTDEKKFRETILSQNEQLTRINNDLDNFIYTASHDLKSPISNIEGLMITLLDTVSENTRQAEEFQAVMNMVFQSVARFKNTIHDLAEITKAQKSLHEEEAMLSVDEMIEEVMLNISNDILSTNAMVSVETEHCPVISFSRKNLHSIIYNLLINAIKYRAPERPPVISVHTFQSDGHCVIEVKDNGLGIKNEHKDRIFQMFKRMHDHIEGSGVGLYIVKRIVDNAGGQIEVESEEGKGSTFRVYLKSSVQYAT